MKKSERLNDMMIYLNDKKIFLESIKKIDEDIYEDDMKYYELESFLDEEIENTNLLFLKRPVSVFLSFLMI